MPLLKGCSDWRGKFDKSKVTWCEAPVSQAIKEMEYEKKYDEPEVDDVIVSFEENMDQ